MILATLKTPLRRGRRHPFAMPVRLWLGLLVWCLAAGLIGAPLPALAQESPDDEQAETTTESAADENPAADEDSADAPVEEPVPENPGSEEPAELDEEESAEGSESATATAPAPPAETIPLELSPYRIQISVAWQADVPTSAYVRQNTLRHARLFADRTIGRLWDLEIGSGNWLIPATESVLARADYQTTLSHVAGDDIDKMFVILIRNHGTGSELLGREWDRLTQKMGPVHSIVVGEQQNLGESLIRLTHRLFHPILEIGEADRYSNTVELKVRGGEFLVPDAAMAQVCEGDLLVPVFRFLTRDREVRQIQTIPWTYLRVLEIHRHRVTAEVITGLNNPLAGPSRRRIDAIALRVRPRWEATTIELVHQSDPDSRLAGHQVDVFHKLFSRDPHVGEAEHLYADRHGRITIPRTVGAEELLGPCQSSDVEADQADPESEDPAPEEETDSNAAENAEGEASEEEAEPEEAEEVKPPDPRIVWLYVRSGSAVLGRVPIVPGLEASAVLAVPDDGLRLQFEGEMELLKSRLIDTVATRAAHMARALKLAEEGKFDPPEDNPKGRSPVDQALAQARDVPSIDDFELQLTSIRVPALEEAIRTRNRGAEVRIERLAQDASTLVRRFLATDKLKVIEERIEELREIHKENKADLESKS